MAYAELSGKEWLKRLKIDAKDVPESIVLEGFYDYVAATKSKSKFFKHIKKTTLPYLIFGTYKGYRLGYSCVYGAPMSVDVVDIMGRAGTELVIQYGSRGGLQPGLKLGDVLIPATVTDETGLSNVIRGDRDIEASAKVVKTLRSVCQDRGLRIITGSLVSFFNITLESKNKILEWNKAGFKGVDMETAATFLIARKMKMMKAAALLILDNVFERKLISRKLTREERTNLQESSRLLFESILETIANLEVGKPA